MRQEMYGSPLTGMYGPPCTTENFWKKKVYDVETGQQCPGEMIMEVKYDAFLPGVIQNLIRQME